MNWKAKPLINLQFVVDLIAATTTTKGLIVKARLDNNLYEKEQKVTDKELSEIKIVRNQFHGEWNYIISPIII